MGASFVTTSCTGSKSDVNKHYQKEKDQDCYENGHSYSGGLCMTPALSIETGYVAPNKSEAEMWLDAHCEKWENAIAVRIKGTDQWVIGAVCAC